jgi:hypothetical protein
MNDKGIGRIFFDLGRATAQFAFYSLGKSERDRYRSKGRMYHYLGMLETKLKNRIACDTSPCGRGDLAL